jgi:putative hydrolase of the HAD superfamily
MEKDLMEYMEKCLSGLKKLWPDKVTDGPKLKKEKCPGLKAVIFDIYGTLLISGSGDILAEKFSSKDLLSALINSGMRVKSKDSDLVGKLAATGYSNIIKLYHENAAKEGINFFEIDIVEVWKKVISNLENVDAIEKVSKDEAYERIAFAFEILTNPVFPMPGMKRILDRIREKNMAMGIISNAQFYTPIIMNYFLEGRIKRDNISGFYDDLSIYSYKQKRSKPDLELFELMKKKLNRYCINPEEAVFVGNDMLKDIYPASKIGFKTCLFAGDSRSLRMRKGIPETENLEPDFVIEKLDDLLDIIT